MYMANLRPSSPGARPLRSFPDRLYRFALAQAAHGWLELEAEGETPEMDGKVKLAFPEWVSDA